MSDQPDHHDERALWRRIAAPPNGSRGDCPPLTDLAAFIDGRLADRERAVVETHLAECPECLAAVRETQALASDESATRTFASPAVIERAKSLVPAGLPRLAPRRREPGPRVTRRVSWRHVGRWGAVAACLVATCLLGYTAGAGAVADTTESLDLAMEMSFGVINGDEATPELDLFVVDDGTAAEEVQP
ncbi:MAG: hypothetical protein GY715_20435 [Planctomycetes bacterium]|nr:hypothetical protein [Planctomycetota bacterium]